tara:strand:+ start:3094 stop:3570 length:477 start_codon:yes stop_codon:yes gene_type:complete
VYAPGGNYYIKAYQYTTASDLLPYSGDLVIASDVIEIQLYRYFKCAKLKTVTVAANPSLEKIGEGAFNKCPNLETVDLSAAPIHTLEEGSFNDCDNLTEALLPPTLNKVGKRVFTNCDRLNKVTMPASLLAIDVFDCAALNQSACEVETFCEWSTNLN